jgi:cellobiose phosphorylase
MNYGRFDDAAREYVITNPRTPVKWINYLGTLAFGGFVDQTGGALICAGDPATNRITRYMTLQPAGEFKATTLYLRLRDGTRETLVAPFYVPTLNPLDFYECHVGLGYTRIISSCQGIRTEATFFVPRGGHRLVLDVRVANRAQDPMSVDAVPVVEYTHFDALKQLTNADWIPQTMQSEARELADGRRVLFQYPFMTRETRVNFLASNLPASSFETERAHFLGCNEYGTWASPLSLRERELGCHEARRGDNIGALLHHLGRMMPGEERRLIVQIGQAAGMETALPGIIEHGDPRTIDRELAQLSGFWDDWLSRLQVKTPDVDTDRMLNIHNPRQCHTTLSWSRYLSLYQLGYGARGIGFRDSSQDAMAVLASASAEACALMRRLLSVQRRDGSAMHQYNPATMEGSMGDAREREDRPQFYSDDHLWIVLAVSEYLKETGDAGFLAASIPFYEKEETGAPREIGTVREHLERAVEFTRTHLGAHGLPLLGFADWNDTINLASGAESLFTANLYGKALREMADIARWQRDPRGAETYATWHEEMKGRFHQHAWDGQWWLRYFDADGTPLGSHVNAKGKIYINAQSWPVIAGFASGEKARTALASLRERLNTRNGIKISAPGFDGYDPATGGITTYPPGAKENCGIFLHTNPWVIIAETMLGNGDRAYEYYRQINPATRNDAIEVFECEPYVYPQNILGDEHPQFGLARNSWLSGTASWAYQAATRRILGLLPTFEGLRIEPCIPAGWDGFTAVREFRGTRYALSVRNPDHVCHGVVSLTVDGRRQPVTLLPLFDDNRTHVVEAILG